MKQPAYDFVAHDLDNDCDKCVAGSHTRPHHGSLCQRLPSACIVGGHYRLRPWWKFWGEKITVFDTQEER
jgi:hypothetical protein